MEKKKRSRLKKIGRPNRILAFFLFPVVYLFYRIRYRVKYDTSCLRGIKGPALVIAPHTSNKDHWLIACALYPALPTFVISEHFTRKPFLRLFMRLAHTVTKKMFCADVSTVMNLLRAKREGNVIVLFPEGRLSCNGRAGGLTDGTAALVRKLGLDVYVITANGASLTFPKWAKRSRRGEIRVTAAKLLTAEETAALPLPVLEEKLSAAIAHDDAAVMQGVAYPSSTMAEGLEGILWLCPECRKSFALQTEGDRIGCSCGYKTRLLPDYRFESGRFPTVLAWYDWQCGELDLTRPLETRARIGTPDAKGYMNSEAGEATVRLDAAYLSLEGVVDGKPLSFSVPTARLGALPATVADHFDVYYANRLYYIYPRPDPRVTVMWVAYLDCLKQQKENQKEDLP